MAQAQTRYALGFDALTDEWDYIAINGIFGQITFGDTYTIETWINTSRTDGGGFIFSQTKQVNATREISLAVGTSGNIGFYHDGTSLSYQPASDIRDGEWHHIAAVKTTEEMILYHNGVQVASLDNTDGATGIGYPVIGRRGQLDSASPFVGYIDDFRIWSTARSATDIRNKRTFKLTGSESGLELYYPLDEGSGTTANDATSNNNDGTILGDLDWIESTVITDSNPDIEAEAGNALRLGSGDEYVQANAVSASLTGDFTLEAWVEPESSQPGGGGAIFALNTSSGGNTMLLMYDDDKDYFRYFDGGTDSATASSYPAGQRYHVALSVASGAMTLYINGAVAHTSTLTATIDATTQFSLGQEFDGATPTNEFEGLMDEVRVWDDARTADEIRALMFTTLNGSEDGLLSYFQFNESSGTTLSDAVGGLDGTLVNMEGDEWEASTIKLGTTALHALSSTGAYTFTDVDLRVSVTAVSGSGSILGARFDESPSTVPSASAIANVYDDRYWIIDAHDFTSLTSDVRFTLSENVSSYEAQQFRLYQRDGDHVTDWTFVGSGTARSGSNVTFSDVPLGGQFVVARVDTSPSTIAGNALAFGDTGAYVQADALSAQLTSNYTLEAWIQPSVSGASNDAIWSVNTSGGDDVVVVFYDFANDRFWFKAGESNIVSAENYPPERLYHVALIHDSATSELSLYVDGERAIQNTQSSTIDASNTFTIGQNLDASPDQEFAGLIDEVRVWKVNRSADQVRASMRAPLSGSEAGLVAYYQFNESSGSTLVDVIGGHDGTLVGMSDEDWTTSNVAFGSTQLQAVTTTGTVTFSDADGALTTTSLDGTGSVVMTLLDEAPTTVPAPLAIAEVFSRYWIVTPYDMNSITGDLTLTLSSLSVTEPGLLKLFHRTNEAEDWAVATSASAINGNDVTFEGIDTFGQFVIAAFEQVTVDAGTMLEFDGTNDYISFSPEAFPLYEGTIEHWVKYDNTDGTGILVTVGASGQNGFGGSTAHEIHTTVDGGKPNFFFQLGEGNVSVTGDTDLAAGQWYHIAATYAYESGVLTLRLYVDGELAKETSETIVLSSEEVAASALVAGHIGAPVNGGTGVTNRLFEGMADEVRIWRAARSQAEIQATLHESLTGLEQDLVMYWPLNEGEADTYATTIADIVGGYDGTLENMVSSGSGISPWEASEVVLGTSQYQAVTATGAYAFPDANFDLNVTSLSGSGAVVSTLVDEAPTSGPSTGAPLYDQSWLVTLYGITDITSDMTFTLPEDVSSDSPVQFKLYQRSGPYATSWTYVGSGTAISGADVTFDAVTGGGQFAIARVSQVPDLTRGNHLFFSGHDQYVRANDVVGQLGNTFTLETWARAASDQQTDFSSILWLGQVGGHYLFLLYDKIDNTQGQFAFNWGTSDRPKTAKVFESGNPHHLAATYDGDQLRLYVDGILEIETDYTPTGYSGSSDFFFMGGTGGFSDNGLRGHMDEVRVFREVRSVDDIRATMHTTLAGNEPGLVAYYQFNEDDGDTFVDVAGGFDATKVDGSSSVGVGGSSIHLVGPGNARDIVSTGTYSFSDAEVEMTVTQANETGQVVASRIDEAPNPLPTATAIDEIYDDRFWAIKAFDLSHLSTATFTFTLPQDVSAYEADRFKLLNLLSPNTGNWTLASTATAVSGSAVTFPIAFDDLNAGGQFVIARIDDLPNPVQENALAFDGADDYLYAHDVTKHLDDDFVLEAWVRPDATTSTESGAIFAVQSADGAPLLRVLYDPSADRFAYYDGSTSAFTDAIYPATLAYHVAVRIEGTSAALYIDGTLAAESAWAQTVDASSLFSIGQVFDESDLTSGAFFNGLIDEVRVWNTARATADLLADRFAALDGTEPGLVLYYQFDESSGTTAVDAEGGYDGTLVGTDDTSWQDAVLFGSSAIYVEAQGLIQLDEPGLDVTYLSQNGVRVQVMRVDKTPDVMPSSTDAAIEYVFDDQYWVIERADNGLFNAILTFSPPFTTDTPFTESDEALPDQIQLYTREAQGESWSYLASASSVDATAGTATFREIRDFSEFIIVRGDVLDEGTVTATDDVYENRVRISWTDIAPNASSLKITRDGELLALVASDETFYDDFAGDPDETYTYCVIVIDADDTELTSVCDTGRRIINPPTTVSATDGSLDTGVLVSWTDNSEVEAEYALYRDGELLSTVTANTTSYLDETASAEVTYTYCVAAVDDRAFESAQACDEGYRGTVLPPTSVTASDGQYPDRVVISWLDATNDEEGFIIYRSSADTVTLATVAPNVTTYDDTGAVSGTTYTYCVATIRGGAESIQVCDTGGINILAAPTSVAASDDTYDDRIEVNWSDAGATESAFRIYRRDLSASDSTALFTTAANVESYLDLTATAATTYRYCVVAVAETDNDDDGVADQEVESAAVCDTGQQAYVLDPVALSATDGDHEDEVVLTWDNPASQAALTEIYRNGSLIKTTVSTNLSYSDQAVASDSTQTYCVAFRTAAGETSAQVCDEGHRVITPPTDVAASDDAEERFVTITWVDQSSVEAGYNIYRIPEDDPDADAFLAGTTTASQSTYADLTGEPGVTYIYRVSAFDAYGESAYDEEDGRRTLLAPTDLTASDGTSETEISLSWTDNSRIEEGYRIYRKTQGATDSTLIVTTEPRVTTYTDTVAADEIGIVFSYSIIAFDDYGTSAAITEDGSTMIMAPSAFNASDVYTDRIELSWIDLSDVEDGYRIYRGTSTATLAELTTVASDAIGYTDSGVVAGEVYTYCIEAYNTSTASTCTDAQDEGRLLEETTQTTDPILTGVIDGASRGDQVGFDVSLDGDYALVGAPQTDGTKGAAYIFQRIDGDWTFLRKLDDDEGCTLTEGDHAGISVALKGNYALVGARNPDTDQGYAMLYQRSGDSWSCTERFPASGYLTGSFGRAVALNDTYGFVGAPSQSPAAVYAYTLASGAAAGTLEHPLDLQNGFGGSLAASDSYVIVGAASFDQDFSNAGTAYVYRVDTWTNPIARLVPSDLAVSDDFGRSVALSDTYAIVGAPESDHSGLNENGSAYLFEVASSSTPWSSLGASGDPTVLAEDQKLTAASGENDRFGHAVALSDTWALVGARNDDNEAGEEGTDASEAGAAFLYQFDGVGSWDFEEQIALTDAVDGDHFGASVAVADGVSVVGAPGRVSDTGAIFFVDSGIAAPDAPDFVTATDGTFSNRIQLAWGDPSDVESGFRIYRDGEVITELSPNNTSYSDFDAAPGTLYTYCVETLSDVLSPSEQVCDPGWRPPNGAISGRIAGEGGGGIADVDVCLAPTPNNALLFDGTGGYARIADDQSLDVGGTFTLETWVRYTDNGGSGTDDAVLIEKSGIVETEDGTPRVTPFALRTARTSMGNAHQLVCERSDADGTTVTVLSDTNQPLNDDTWYHVACVSTQSAAGGILELYVDGVQSSSTAFSAPLNDTSVDTDLYLGRREDSEEAWFGGQLDEVRLWDYARTIDELNASMSQPLVGTEDGLLGYWPLDQEGTVLPNFAGRPNHIALVNGVYLANTAAPLDVCGSTDVDGNYTIAGIRYGESTTFTVTPGKDQRIFQPSSKTITLSPESPVQNEVTFVDASAFTISGLVEYPSPFDSSVCPAEGVELFLGAAGEDLVFSGTTESDGYYSVSAQIGELVLEPRLTDTEDTGGDGLIHTFDPDFRTIDVQGDATNINFLNQTTRTLTGFAGGNCNTPIGPVKLKFFTANGCFEHEVEVEGSFSLDLPPQQYFVQVVELDPPDALDNADVIAYFDALGVQEIDLTTQADTLELIYEAPLTVSISGTWPSAQACAADDQLGVPILTQSTLYDVTVAVEQDYGDGNICRVEEGIVTVFDEISDGVAGGIELAIEDGIAIYDSLQAGQPNILAGLLVDDIDRSYQKSFTAVVDIEGRDPVTEVQWVMVEGQRVRASEFTTVTTEPTPLMILRDPPGDASSASLNKGTTVCNTVTDMFVFGAGITTNVKQIVGSEGDIGFGVGLGSQVIRLEGTKTTTEWEANVDIGDQGTIKDITKTCVVVDEQFSTSSGEKFIGEDADILVGVGYNFIFAKTDELSVDGSCEVQLTESLGAAVSDVTPFSTTYVYTQNHIENNVIPELQSILDTECPTGDDSCISALTDPETGSVVRLDDAIANWYGQLEEKQRTKEEALSGDDVTNRSFSAGTSYSYSEKMDETTTSTRSLKVYANSSTSLGTFFKLGNGVEIGFKTKTEFAYTDEETDDETVSAKAAYTLSDNDKGDSFTVDTAFDPVYGSFAFDLASGVTSNPWEPGVEHTNAFDPCRYDADDPNFGCELETADGFPFSQPRDKPTLSITPPERIGANPNEPALFTLGLGNESESQETRSYTLQSVLSSNPYGAILRANGAPLDVGQTYRVEPGAVQNITLEVDRGPLKYNYEDLAVRVFPASEVFSPYADTAFFSVEFASVCSDISLLRPLHPWTRTAEDTEDLEIIANEFFLASPDVAVASLGIEYRQAGDATWLPIETLSYTAPEDLSASDLANYPDGWYANADQTIILDVASTSFTTTWHPPADGAYELRAFTDCGDSAVIYSESAPGTVDTAAPQLFGTPEPADFILNLGDAISASFNEDIACSTLVTSGEAQNVFLTAPDGSDDDSDPDVLAVEVVCDGRTFFLTPGVDLSAYQGQQLTVTLTGGTAGLADMFGNHLETDDLGNDVTWSFTVNQSGFAFVPRNIEIDVTKGTLQEVEVGLFNGRGQEIAFATDATLSLTTGEVGETPVELTPDVTAGTIVPNGSQRIRFTLPETLHLGTWSGTLSATATEDGADLGATLFSLKANVVCEAPSDWTVDAAQYQYSMAVNTQLFVSGVASTDEADQIVAIVGTEVRGVGYVQEVAGNGTYRVSMLVYSNVTGGEAVTFHVWDDSDCALYEETSLALAFTSNAVFGTVQQPVTLEAPRPDNEQAIPLAAGWTWFSINTTETSMAVSDILSDVPATAGDVLKSQRDFAIYDNTFGWEGTLFDLEAGAGYLIQLQQSHDLELTGAAVTPTDPIALVEGWNWIGYLPQAGQPVSDALASITSSGVDSRTAGDLIKSQYAFAEFVDGATGWVGSLTRMEPGLGYQIQVSQAGELVYAEPTSQAAAQATRIAEATPQALGSSHADLRTAELDKEAVPRDVAMERMPQRTTPALAEVDMPDKDKLRRSAEVEVAGQPALHWQVEPQGFSETMAVTAELWHDGLAVDRTDLLVGVFVGDELRAVAQPTYVEALGAYRVFLLVYGDALEAAPLAVRVFDPLMQAATDDLATIRFAPNGRAGALATPLQVMLPTFRDANPTSTTEAPRTFALHAAYPNPFNPVTMLSYDVAESADVRLEVFDAMGRRVAVVVNEQQPPGRYQVSFEANGLASGTYFYRLQAGTFQAVQRMLLVK
ncbi:MAG: LamG-like jellyroll fold domain-containing protein [Bacteroidota bacterium]